MDNRRFMLIAVLGVVLFFIYQAWQKDYGPKPLPPTDVTRAVPGSVEAPEGTNGAGTVSANVLVETDLMRLTLSLKGGDVQRLELLGIPVSKEAPNRNIFLLNEQGPAFFVVQSGLIAPEGDSAPDHRSLFKTGAVSYRLADGSATLEVPLTWNENGRTVTKTYVFKRGSYAVELRQTVKNEGAAYPLSNYVRLWRAPVGEAAAPPFVQSFMGLGWYEQKETDKYRFTKLTFEDITEDPVRQQQVGGWVSMLEHYFAVAAIPAGEGMFNYFGKPKLLDNGRAGYEAGYVGPQRLVEAGATISFEDKLYLGPKLQGKMADIAPGFELTEDYGVLTVVATPLFWVLEKFHGLTGNWGFAIILLTLAVKLAFWKLTEAQYRSMARMKKFAPRIQALKERYADDRQGMQKAMMELYQKEKFNPLGGCWPLLVQFPVFIALYWVLSQSVELRQAPFVLWIHDMSAPDPFYILPVLFGISMWVQQKLSGSAMAMDPMQQRMMNIMPIGMTAFFAFFPAGLVVYWFVSNLIGIGQQWYITRKIEQQEAAKKA